MTVSELSIFLTVPLAGLRFVILIFPDHTHLLLLYASGEDSGDFAFMSSAGDKAYAARICNNYKKIMKQNSIYFTNLDVCSPFHIKQSKKDNSCHSSVRVQTASW